MTPLQLAAAMIRRNVPDLPTLIGLLENAKQKRLANELRKGPTPALPTVQRGVPDPQMWLRGTVR
jgi:hypothetical protein